jgi:hypothetical protein
VIGGADAAPGRSPDAGLVVVLDHQLLVWREDLLPVIDGLQGPARLKVLFHGAANAGSVLLNLGEADVDQRLPFVLGQRVERVAGRSELWCEGNAEPLQQCGSVDALGEDLLLDLCCYRLTICRCCEGEKIDRVLRRNGDVRIRAVNRDVRHRESDEAGDSPVAVVEEMVGDADLSGRDEQLFRSHLDVRIIDEIEPTCSEFGGRVVGASSGDHHRRPNQGERYGRCDPHPRYAFSSASRNT